MLAVHVPASSAINGGFPDSPFSAPLFLELLPISDVLRVSFLWDSPSKVFFVLVNPLVLLLYAFFDV